MKPENRQATVKEFAEWLIYHGVYYFTSNTSIHARITETGGLVFWSNYKGMTSSDFQSLSKLLACNSVYEIPMISELRGS